MIKAVKLKNVKCFLDKTFELSPLTVFCGSNSAGKSTVIQSLLLLKQSYDAQKLALNKIVLSGKLFNIGQVKDIRAQRSISGDVIIKVDDFSYESVQLSSEHSSLYYIPLKTGEVKIHQFLKADLYYLNAYRLPPQNSYDVSLDSDYLDIGIYGEYTVSVLEQLQTEPARNQELSKIVWNQLHSEQKKSKVALDESLDFEYEEYTGKDIKTAAEYIEVKSKKNIIKPSINEQLDKLPQYLLGATVKEAMRNISSGFDIKLNGYSELDKVSNSFGSHDVETPVRPINTGFGISYVLPIIVAALCSKKGSTLIVENPEVHLHPSAQAELAKFLAYTSLSGVQVILETHSDHIINGIRVFAKNTNLDDKHIIINNIRSDFNKNKVITPIKVLENGDLSCYEDGFFDQITKDLMRLFE